MVCPVFDPLISSHSFRHENFILARGHPLRSHRTHHSRPMRGPIPFLSLRFLPKNPLQTSSKTLLPKNYLRVILSNNMLFILYVYTFLLWDDYYKVISYLMYTL